jgi:hypothetical protein
MTDAYFSVTLAQSRAIEASVSGSPTSIRAPMHDTFREIGKSSSSTNLVLIFSNCADATYAGAGMRTDSWLLSLDEDHVN